MFQAFIKLGANWQFAVLTDINIPLLELCSICLYEKKKYPLVLEMNSYPGISAHYGLISKRLVSPPGSYLGP